MKSLKQMLRGCTTLPHVGEHPGTACLFIFILLGALAGRDGGLAGCLGGAAFMTVFIGPIYLYGAYGRAQVSDEIESGIAKKVQP